MRRIGPALKVPHPLPGGTAAGGMEYPGWRGSVVGHGSPLPRTARSRKRLAGLPRSVHDRAMGVSEHIGRALAPVVDLVFPPRCPLCGAGLAAQDGLCAACWSELAIPGEPCCARCQRPIASDAAQDGTMCAPCLATPPRHDGIAAATLYNPASRKLILSFKHGRKIALAPMMARLIAARLPQTVGPEWLFIPVPLHRWRLWRRGFNQSALLAREMARLRQGQACVDTLVRRKATPSLGGLGRKARRRALSGAIALAPHWQARVRGARIELVDDVLTSGATSEACVAALRRAGAEQVVIACFARVADEALTGQGGDLQVYSATR